MLPEWWDSDKPWIIDDCLKVMKGIPDNAVDLILTDPPYGIGVDYGETYDDTMDNWYELIGNFLPSALRISKMMILPACSMRNLEWFYQKCPPDWLICWYKGSPGHLAYIGFNDWEAHLVYGKIKGLQMHDFFYAQPNTKKDEIGHPCPKPLAWATWLIERATKKGDIVFDPFLGSGTTLKACRHLDRIGIGTEINPDYEPIIEKRSLSKLSRLEDFIKL